MSAPISELAILGSALGVAFLGSPHCAAMCGPIAAQARTAMGLPYQVGRLLGYLVLGLAFGASGDGLLRVAASSSFFTAAIVFLMIGLMVWQATLQWRGLGWDQTPVVRVYGALYRVLSRFMPSIARVQGGQGRVGAFSLGLGSALLPCGAIVSFALLAAASQSAFHGALIFLALWMGSLPALSLIMWGIGRGSGFVNTPLRQKTLAVTMMVVGIIAIAHRPGWESSQTSHVQGDLKCGNQTTKTGE